MNETLRTVDGRPALRMERRLAHPPEKVWRAVTEPEHLSRWYPFPVAELDLRVGGRIRFDGGQGAMLDAVVTELERPRVFAFEVAAQAGTPGGREGFNGIRFELRPQGDGCLLVFTHVFDDRAGRGQLRQRLAGLPGRHGAAAGRPAAPPAGSAGSCPRARAAPASSSPRPARPSWPASGPPPWPPGRPSWPAWSGVAGAEAAGYRPLEVNTEELRVPQAPEAAP